MISRQWRGLAKLDCAEGYINHLQMTHFRSSGGSWNLWTRPYFREE
jgi:hypothetical protein